jgi:two-component system nitrogen regulation sensor histidine kinase GlnL
MDRPLLKLRKTNRRVEVNADAVLNALPSVILVVAADLSILHVNNAAEQFFQSSAQHLEQLPLDKLLPPDSPLFSLIRQARATSSTVAEYHITLSSPRIGQHIVNVQAAPVHEVADAVVISFQERSVAAKIDHQLTHRGAARSISAMAAMLAHEVKNPLAGIRGAAQLLEQGVRPEDQPLTRLIREETDRVCAIVNRMEAFSASGPPARGPVNIHEILGRVRALAENSFGRHVRFVDHFDPSLPPVFGNKDQLIQVFLNLVKNAAEAAPVEDGEVTITTAYWHGVRFAVAGSQSRVELPLMISVQDNGTGIPDDLKPHLFEPFVTTKARGSGLGLALVAKIIGDHGGVIEFESEPRRTVFRVMLPMYPGGDS